jgi:pimeloyl-ACP methyl ester carboxylesterase
LAAPEFLTLKERPMRMITVQGITIATESFGRTGDPTVLLVMGSTASMLGWPEAFCQSLVAQGLHVIRFDHRDTGQSTTVAPGAARYVVEDMAADLVAILEAYGLDRAHLVGMSLGGYIAQMMALSWPSRVASLTLIASEPLGWDGAPLPHISDAFMVHFGTLSTLDWSDRSAVAAFLVEGDRLCAGNAVPFDAEASQATVERVLDRTISPASMFNHGALTTREEWTTRFREIACPVLVIHGLEDPILPVENGKAIAAGIAGAELMVLPGVGHELPERLFGMLADRIAMHTGSVRY